MLCLTRSLCPSNVLDPRAWVLSQADPQGDAIRFSIDQKEQKKSDNLDRKRLERDAGEHWGFEKTIGGEKVTYADLLSRLSFKDSILRHTFDDVQANPLIILGQLDIVFICDPARNVESGLLPYL